MISYLENSPHYARIRRLRESNNIALKEKLNGEINEIDSLKRVVSQNIMPRNAGGLVYGEPLDPVKMYDAAALMFKQRLGLNWESEYLNNFELLKPCMPSSRPIAPNLLRLLVYCVGLSLLCCFVYNLRKHKQLTHKPSAIV